MRNACSEKLANAKEAAQITEHKYHSLNNRNMKTVTNHYKINDGVDALRM